MPTLIRQTALADILIRRGLLTTEQLDTYHAETQGSERQLRAALVREQVLSETAWAEALAEQYGLPFEALDGYRVDFERFADIPVEAMRQFGFVPIDEREGILVVAVADPHDLRLVDHVDRDLGPRIPRGGGAEKRHRRCAARKRAQCADGGPRAGRVSPDARP